jgi:glutamyl-tRNA reductase
MLEYLKLWNFPSGHLQGLETSKDVFVLKTCQRTLVLTLKMFPTIEESHRLNDKIEGLYAYQYLLETICGLKSRLIGENEIVGQFKEAYQKFSAIDHVDSRLKMIIEKLFHDAKFIRSKYLIGLGQKTYASITRKHFISMAHAPRVVVLGSGQLAQDVINQLKKKATVFISARDEKKVSDLCESHQIESLPWNDLKLLTNEAFICNTIGFDGELLGPSFFEEWSKLHTNKLFVDLGSPSCINNSLSFAQGMVRLSDILAQGAIVESQKRNQVHEALIALEEVTIRRSRLLEEWLEKWQTAKEESISLS